MWDIFDFENTIQLTWPIKMESTWLGQQLECNTRKEKIYRLETLILKPNLIDKHAQFIIIRDICSLTSSC